MTIWDMSQLPAREQFGYWHEVICQAFVPLTPSRKYLGGGFPSNVETRPLLQINRARIASQPQTTRHGPREVSDTDGAFYFVNLQLAGRCFTRHCDEEGVVQPGQFVLVDTTQPYYFDFDDTWQMMSYRIPQQHLRVRLAGARPLLGVPIDGRGLGGVVTSLMRALWDVDDTPGITRLSELEESFASAVSAVAMAGGEPPAREAMRAAVMRYARDHLADRTLSVSTVCRRFGISPRTLHNLFADAEDSFAATIRALRLDRCAAILANPATTATIADIAVAHGFDDPTSFSRAFRRRHGMSPREARSRMKPCQCTNSQVDVH
jgi:AraC family transcriptional activator of tynA and feaB